MKPKHVVFVESNQVGLEAFAAAKELGCRVTFVYSPQHSFLYGTDISNRAFSSVDLFQPVANSMDADNLERALVQIHKADKIDAVVTVSEYCILAAAKAAFALGIPATSGPAVECCRNKRTLRLYLQQKGIETVRCSELNTQNYNEWTIFPAIVKPSSGAASLYARKVDSREEIKESLNDFHAQQGMVPSFLQNEVSRTGLMIEEYLVGLMLSVEVMINDGQVQVLTIGERKRWKEDEVIELGTTMPSPISESLRTQVNDYVIHICESLAFGFGMIHIELMKTATGLRIIEINPRLMGGSLPLLYQRVHDYSVFKLLISAHLGIPHSDALPAPKRFGVSCLLGSSADGYLLTEADVEDITKSIPEGVEFRFLSGAGQRIPRLKSNHDYFGRIMATHPDAQIAQSMVDKTVDIIEKIIGIPLAK